MEKKRNRPAQTRRPFGGVLVLPVKNGKGGKDEKVVKIRELRGDVPLFFTLNYAKMAY